MLTSIIARQSDPFYGRVPIVYGHKPSCRVTLRADNILPRPHVFKVDVGKYRLLYYTGTYIYINQYYRNNNMRCRSETIYTYVPIGLKRLKNSVEMNLSIQSFFSPLRLSTRSRTLSTDRRVIDRVRRGV